MPSKWMTPTLTSDCLSENELHVSHKSTKPTYLAAFRAVDKSCDIITPSDVSGQDCLFFHQLSTIDSIMPSSISGSMSNDGKDSISTADPVIDQMIFSPLFDHGEFQDTISSHIIEDQGGNYFPYLVPSNGNDTCSVPIDDNRPRETSHLCTTSSFSKHLEVSNSSGDYDHDSNSLNYDFMFDVPEKYMILPLLERTKGEDLVKEDVHHSLSLNYCQSVYQMDGLEEDTFEFPHIKGSTPLDMQLSTENFHDLSEVSSMWAMFFPKETRRRKTVTLVLDLDETLVHSTLEHCPDADFTFPVSFNAKEHTVYVRQRPYLHEFLQSVSKMFRIVIFTASQSIYAEQLLDNLDPDKSIISQRIYRESCVFSDGIYTKDLSILGIDMAKVFIIDNSPQVFRFQVNNGIPIKSWFDDPSDCALLSLLPFLETLVDADDVRPIISERFKKE